MPDAFLVIVADEERGVVAWLQDAESDSGVSAGSVGGDLHELHRERCGFPALGEGGLGLGAGRDRSLP